MTTKQSNIEWTKCGSYDDTYLGKDVNSDLSFEIFKMKSQENLWTLKVELQFGDSVLSDCHHAETLSKIKSVASKVNSDFKALYQGE